MLITVFTPTYNRAHLLPRLYESLQQQTFRDFEWLIVDDGSSDETREVVNDFRQNHHSSDTLSDNSHSEIREGKVELTKEETQFPIHYIYKKNGGKHTAINVGVKEAKGELFFILDSDDALPPTALADVAKVYEDVKDDDRFAGVCGMMSHRDGKIISCGIEADMLDSDSLDFRYKYNIKGDLMEVFKTTVMRHFPFPCIEKERFCPEALIWNRIAKQYQLRLFKRVVCFRDYLGGGLTDNIVKIRMQSPIASMMTYAEMTQYDNVPAKHKMKAAINYWRFRFCYDKKQRRTVIDSKWDSMPTIGWQWIAAMPLGYVMHVIDKNKQR